MTRPLLSKPKGTRAYLSEPPAVVRNMLPTPALTNTERFCTIETVMDLRQLNISANQLADFCRRWNVRELALFGSVLRDDFSPQSDIDVLVEFAPDARPSLFDHVEMQDELSALFGRKVDLVTKKGLKRSRNVLRRNAILESARVVHAVT